MRHLTHQSNDVFPLSDNLHIVAKPVLHNPDSHE
jgi:hypothetical protein